jgi:predicted DNA-binding transcriptional regulator YafY
MTEQLPDAVSVRLDAMADCLSILPPIETSYDMETFEAIARAAVGRRRVEMVYWTAGRNKTTRRGFDPYTLMLRDEGWYAVGRCHQRNEVLVFALQRVRSVRETDEPFDRPDDFRVEDYMGGSFRTVRGEGHHRVALRFTPEFAGRIAERIWHPSQSIERMEDGGLILRFEVSDLREIIRFVMYWGVECQATEPAELREAIFRECRAMLARHDDEPADPE